MLFLIYFILFFNFTILYWFCCFWTVMLEKILESPLDSKEIKLVNPKGNQYWIFIERIDAKVEALILWSPDVKNWLIRKDPDSGQDWRQEEKETTEDDMVGCPHQLYGHESEQVLGTGNGQGSLACCTPWGHKKARHYLETEQQQVLNIEIHPSASFQKFSTTWHIPWIQA